MEKREYNERSTIIPKLYVLVGLPGSGKSTYAKKLESESVNRTKIVSTDAIREELACSEQEMFRLFHERIRSYLELGYDVIADATNITIKSRAAVLASVKEINCIKTALVFGTDFQVCLANNSKRDRKVPEEAIYTMRSKFQIPFYEEGFDIIHIRNQAKNDEVIEEAVKKMKTFDQQNEHHNLLHFDHCQNVKEKFTNKYTGIEYVRASLLHDIGKLFTQTFGVDNQAHYYGHAEVGSYFLLSNAEVIGSFNEEFWLKVLFIVNYHMMPFNWNTEKAQRKWKKIFGEDRFSMLVYFNECDQEEL